jgi:prepilin-type N-terminal cleavage/methylation domain-containing protein
MRCQKGFTLTETMIIVVIVGVLAGITIPAFMNYFQRQKAATAETELLADISYVRSLAIARRTTFQIVFNGDAYQIIEPGPDTVMRQREAPSGITITSDQNPRFFPHGLAEAANIVVSGRYGDSAVTLLPNGTATHD